MTIHFTVKSIGKKMRHTETIPFVFAKTPSTLRDLVCETVLLCVQDFNRRPAPSGVHETLTPERIDSMASIGKIGFGLRFSDRTADPDKAVATAISGLEDGLFRVFINDIEVTGPDTPLNIRDNDHVAIIHLTMLTGRIF